MKETDFYGWVYPEPPDHPRLWEYFAEYNKMSRSLHTVDDRVTTMEAGTLSLHRRASRAGLPPFNLIGTGTDITETRIAVTVPAGYVLDWQATGTMWFQNAADGSNFTTVSGSLKYDNVNQPDGTGPWFSSSAWACSTQSLVGGGTAPAGAHTWMLNARANANGSNTQCGAPVLILWGTYRKA